MKIELKGKVIELGRKNESQNGKVFQEIVIEKKATDENGDVLYERHYNCTLVGLKCPKVGNKVNLTAYIGSKQFEAQNKQKYWNTSINCTKIEILK